MPGTEPVGRELERSARVVRDLVGSSVSSLSLARFDASYAPFLARNVSKLSPLIASLVEIRTVEMLNEGAEGWLWLRQEPATPDAALLTESGESTDAGFEIKAWHALSTEITGRFRESRALLEKKRISVLLVAWVLDHIVWGTPTIIQVAMVDAVRLAEARDRAYYQPPRYLVFEPTNTADRTPNLQQTQVAGYRLQEPHPEMVKSAEAMVRAAPAEAVDPYSPEADQLRSKLYNTFEYRLETNFAKLDRIGYPEVEGFKNGAQRSTLHGRSIADWTRVFRVLADQVPKAERLAEATQAVAPLFAT